MESNLTAIIEDYSVSLEFGINNDAHSKDVDLDTFVLNNLSTITLKTVITNPKDRKNIKLVLEFFSGQENSASYTSKLELWKNYGDSDQRQENPYIPPQSIGHIGRSRKNVMEGWVNIPQMAASNLLSLLKLNKPIYLHIESDKTSGTRFVKRILVQHVNPDNE